MNVLGRIITILLALILILFLPLQYLAQSQVETMDHIVEAHTHEFTDNIRQKGSITLEDYEEYLYKINQTKELYSIEIEHATPKTLSDLTLNVQEDIRLASTNNYYPSMLNTLSINESQNTRVTLSLLVRTNPYGSEQLYSHYLISSGDGGKTWDEPIYIIARYNARPEDCDKEIEHVPNEGYYYFGGKIGSRFYFYDLLTKNVSSRYKFPDSISVSKIMYVNDKIFVIQDIPGSHSITRLYVSTNKGLSFTGGTQFASQVGINNIAYGNGVYVASGYKFEPDSNIYNKAVIYTSYDGIKWENTLYYGLNGGRHGNADIIFTGDRFIGKIGSYNYVFSYDGINWTHINNKLKEKEAHSLAYGNGTLVLLDSNSRKTFVTKDYGETIQEKPLPSSISNITKIKYHNGLFWGVRIGIATQNSTLCSSSDGINWTVLSVPFYDTALSVAVYDMVVNSNENPTFNKSLVSIEATPKSQNIQRYDSPIFNVTAIYDDDTSEVLSKTEYTITGFDNAKLGTQTVTFTYTENNVTKTATSQVTVTNLIKICPVCGTRYELDNNDVDNGCPNCASIITKIEAVPDLVTVSQGSTLPITVYGIYKNGGKAIINNWTSNYEPLRLGYQQVTISYGEFKAYITVQVLATKTICAICGNEYQLYEDGSDPGCPICSTTVISIKAEPNPIIIEMYQTLNLHVTATFKDGHTEVVSGWSTDMIPNIPGTFNITIFYKSVTEQITVTIVDDDLTECPYCGTSFSRSKHPNGCPDCSVTLIGIEASLRNGGTTVIKGSKLDLEMVLIFKDTHREATYNGYTISNYQADLVGEQTVIVKYKDFQYNLVIEVINTFGKITCPNGHVYHLNEDGNDPGCPYCIDNGDREKILVYYDITYTTEIIETLYNQNIYRMKTGDYFTLVVTKKNKSIRSQIIKIFNYSKEKNNFVSYGGEVIG